MFYTTQDLLDYALEKTPNGGERNYPELLVSHILQTIGGMLPKEHSELNGLPVDSTMRSHMKATKSLIEKDLSVKIFSGDKVSVLQGSPLHNHCTYQHEEPTMAFKKKTATKKTAAKKTAAVKDTNYEADTTPGSNKKQPANGIYAPKGKTGRVIWDALPNGEDTAVKVGDVAPRPGTANEEVVEAVKSFGRKKATAAAVIDKLEASGWPHTKASNYVSGGLNIGILAEA